MKKNMANAKNAVENATNASTKPAGWKQDLARIQAGDEKDQSYHIEYTAMTATAVSSLLSNAFLCATVLGLFSVLRNRYPLVRTLYYPCHILPPFSSIESNAMNDWQHKVLA